MGKGDGPEDIKGSANILGAIGMRADRTQGVDKRRSKESGGTAEGQTYFPEEREAAEKRRERECNNLDWWAQEQRDNVGLFEQVQADLEAVREGVRAHMERQKAEQGFSIGLGENTPDGPDNLHFGPGTDLQNLNEPSVVVDHVEYTTISLGAEEIAKCKQACYNLGLPRERELGNRRANKDGKMHKADVEDSYVVEFPVDEEEESMSHKNKLQEGKEKALTVATNKMLVLKRPWEVTLNKRDTEAYMCDGRELRRKGNN